MADRPSDREIERTQPGIGPSRDDGAGLREHIETHKLPPEVRVAQERQPVNPLVMEGAQGNLDVVGVPEPLPRRVPGMTLAQPIRVTGLYQVYDAHARLARTYPPEQATQARQYARNLQGFCVPVAAEDYRP